MVFISYKSEEYHIARSIRLLLEENHYPCWMAPESIAAGGNYMTEIPKAIRSCDLFVLILSNASQNSQWVQKELDRAVKFNKYILPFHVDDSELIDEIDFVISNNQRIEAYRNFEVACRELLETVRVRHPAVSAVSMPDVRVPDATVPDVSMPDVSMPDVSVPDVSMPEVTVPKTQIPPAMEPSATKLRMPGAAMKKPITPVCRPTPVVTKPTPAATQAAQKKQSADEQAPAKTVTRASVRQVSAEEMRGTYERNYEQNNPKGFKVHNGELIDYKSSRKESGIVVVPFGVKEIAGSVFAKCKSMHCVVLPPTLEKIGTNAFLECTSLEKVIFHEGLVQIDVGAFQGCCMLKTVELPQTLAYIGAYAFYECKSAALAIPSAVKYIGAAAFNICANVSVQGQNSRYTVNGGCIVDTVEHSVVSAIADATVPASADVKSIGDYAFDGNCVITHLNLSGHITKIGMGAFRGCLNLTEVHLGAGMKTVESQAFMGCAFLQTLTMELGIETIEQQAFAQCKSLKRVTIPKSVRTRAKDAFEGCPRIKITE